MNRPPEGIKKILVVNLAFIGDVILATPVLRALKANYPQATIDLLTIPLAGEIAQRIPYVDQVRIYDKRGRHKKWSELWQLIKELREQQYDLAIAMNFALRSALMAWVTGAPIRVGYAAQHGQWFLTHPVPPDRSIRRHESENHLAILAPLRILDHGTTLALVPAAEDLEYVAQLPGMATTKKKIALCPVGSYPQKSWTMEGNRDLLVQTAESCEWFLVGGSKERPYLEELNKLARNVAHVHGGDLNLRQTLALLSRCDALVTVDTGPLHMAQAVGTPVVAIFGPTDPVIWGPRGERDIILQAESECAPCWGRTPCSEGKPCLQQLSVDRVISAVRQVVKLEGESR